MAIIINFKLTYLKGFGNRNCNLLIFSGFGPCWVNLYGSARDYSYFNENNQLNNGIVSLFHSFLRQLIRQATPHLRFLYHVACILWPVSCGLYPVACSLQPVPYGL